MQLGKSENMNILRICLACTNTYLFSERKWEKDRKEKKKKEEGRKEEREKQCGKKGGARKLGNILPKCNGFQSPVHGILVLP